MLKKIISVLILSAILVSSFGVIAFADDEIYPYSDTSIIPLSREEFLTTYAVQLGLSPDGSEIPEDDHIFLVRNEFGDYGDLYREGNLGRLLRSYEFRVTMSPEIDIDYDLMRTVGFLDNPLRLYMLHPTSNVFGAFESYNTDLDAYPFENGHYFEPIITEFFLFIKSENFSGNVMATFEIINKSKNNSVSEIYSSEFAYYAEPLRIMVDGEMSNSITVGEGSPTYQATFLDYDGSLLWETAVPVGLRTPRILLGLNRKSIPGGKYIFDRWDNYTTNPIAENMTYTAVYAVETDPRGDINDDGVVNTKDVVQLLKGLKSGSSGLDRERADVNLDGVVGYDDVTYMLEAFTEAREW